MSLLKEQKEAALSYIEALNSWDFDKIKSLCSDLPTFKYQFRPATLGGFGHPDGFDKQGLLVFAHHLHDNIIKEFNVSRTLSALSRSQLSGLTTAFFPPTDSSQLAQFGNPDEVQQSENNIAIWIRANGTAHDNSKYTNEYIMLITFEPSTSKFHNVVEFMDSHYIVTLQERLKDAKSQV
ncbi:hypothetical protein T439DRAFT_347895 [Meredithblackwellia eburnea MCA 4105]